MHFQYSGLNFKPEFCTDFKTIKINQLRQVWKCVCAQAVKAAIDALKVNTKAGLNFKPF
jgi:hypothetical protein